MLEARATHEPAIDWTAAGQFVEPSDARRLEHGPRDRKFHLKIDRASQTLFPAAFDSPPEALRPDRDERAKARVIADAAAVARVLAGKPGLGVRELRSAVRVEWGIGSERVEVALTLLGAAVVVGAGPRNAKPMTLDPFGQRRDFRVCVALGTDNKAVARRKLARLLKAEGPAAAEAAAQIESFELAARAIVQAQAEDGLKSWKDRVRRLTAWAFPAFGQIAVNAVRPPHVQDALDACCKAGKSRRTVMHLLVDISTVLDELWRQELIPENVARKVRVPKNARVDRRERVILTDVEFGQFMACADVSAELHVMALTSRTLGGMRTSDLHAWDWSHVDTLTWADAHIPRPKTKSCDRIALPGQLVPVLQAWRESHGRSVSGPVFPVRRGPRAGERKRGKISYAASLRDALWRAGVVRPLLGFAEAVRDWSEASAAHRSESTLAAAEARARRLCLIQAGSVDLKPVDFHSFRRSYNTGLANAGVNVQTAMRLAGHKNASTHMRYVLIAETLETPAAALPNLVQALALPKPLPFVANDKKGIGPLTTAREPTFSAVGQPGLEPGANGLRVRCSTN